MIQGSLPNSWWSSAPYTGSISQHSVTSEERPWACHMHTTLVRHQWKNYTHRRAWCHMEHPVVLYANWLSVVSITHINSIPLWRKCGPHNDDSHSDKHLTNIYFTRVVARMDDNIQFESKKSLKKSCLSLTYCFSAVLSPPGDSPCLGFRKPDQPYQWISYTEVWHNDHTDHEIK